MVRLLTSALRVSGWRVCELDYFPLFCLPVFVPFRWGQVESVKDRFSTYLGVRGHNDGKTEGPTFKSQIKACRSAEDEKIVALILETRKPKHMHAHAHCNRRPKRTYDHRTVHPDGLNEELQINSFFRT